MKLQEEIAKILFICTDEAENKVNLVIASKILNLPSGRRARKECPTCNGTGSAGRMLRETVREVDCLRCNASGYLYRDLPISEVLELFKQWTTKPYGDMQSLIYLPDGWEIFGG